MPSMTDLSTMPVERLASTRNTPFEFLDVYGKTWQEHPDWKPGDPWEDRWVYPEDEGYQTLGWQIIEWGHTYVNSPNGTGRLRLTPEQQRFILHWYSFDPETEMPRFREACFVRVKGPICDDELVPTPDGYVRHGDLRTGSRVFAPDGSITEVTAVVDHGVIDESVRITFSDRSSVECSIDHRFPVDTFTGDRRVPEVKTPREMLSTGLTFERKLTTGRTKASKGGVSRYRVKASPAREGVERDFVIDPYVFGYWLGDGDKDGPRITCHEGELEWLRSEFESRGMVPNKAQNTHGETYRFRFGNGIALTELRRLGVIGDKHIPQEYMGASIGQRTDLLRGIVDSDGHVSKQGDIEISLRSDDNLAETVVDLCHSLGLHPKVSRGKTYLNGRRHSDRTRIKITSHDFHCALMPRKREREVKVRREGSVAPFSRSRMVTSIEPLGERPVSCIEVAHPSSQYLVGRAGIPTCNSGKDPLAAFICIVEFVGPCRLGGWDEDGEPVAVPHPNPLVQLAAVSKEQNQNTSSLFPVMMDQEFQDMFEVNIGVELSYAQRRRCTLKVLTSNFRTQEGSRPSCVIENEALALDTPIPTPTGWTTMGDLQDGDEVYAVDGSITTVEKAHPIQYHRRCFRVTFDDGTSVVASDGHKWLTKHNAAREWSRKTTLEMFESRTERYALPAREPIETRDADLPIDPYVLGLWLGDGAAGAATIACHKDDLHETLGEIWRAGYTSAIQYDKNHIRVAGGRVKGRTGTSLQSQLRIAGLIRNKHIPAEYMRASHDQRLALLQGLMDSDGSIRGRDGTVRFTGTDEGLVMGVFELSKSLGLNAKLPRWQTRDPERWPDRAHWKPCGFVAISADESTPMFRLKRKVGLLNPPGRRRRGRSIVKIEEVGSVPVRCLTVAHESHLFLCGEGFYPTSNTHHWVFSKGGLDFHEVLGRNLNKRGYADPWARRVMITNAYKPSEESVARMIREGWEDGLAGRSVDTGTLLYDSLEVRSDVPLKPPESEWTGTDAAGNPAATVEDRIQWLVKILSEVRGDAFWLNPRQTSEEILAPQNQDSISQSRRFYLNQVTAAEEAWLDRADIRAAIDEDVEHHRKNVTSTMDAYEVGWTKVGPDEPVVLFFDGSKSNDATALVGCRVSDGYTFTCGVWQKPTNLTDEEAHTWRVDRAKVDAQIKRVMARFRVVAFWGDPSHAKDEVDYTPYWDSLFDEWHERYSEDLNVWAVRNDVGGHSIMWDMTSPQRTAQFVEAAQKTVDDFESLNITIDGHPALVSHLTNAQEREDEKNGITLGKESRYSPRKIDLAVCLVGARMLRRIVLLGGHEDGNQSGEFWGF